MQNNSMHISWDKFTAVKYIQSVRALELTRGQRGRSRSSFTYGNETLSNASSGGILANFFS